MINNNFPFEKVLKRRNKQRYLKIPSQFNTLLYGDIATILTSETNDYIEIIYRFEIDNLKNGKQIRIEQIRIEQKRIEQERLKQTKNNEIIAKLKKDHKFKKAFEVEKELKGHVLCEFCNELLNKKVTMFVNVIQNPVHYFCNKDCKLNWIYKLQEKQ